MSLSFWNMIPGVGTESEIRRCTRGRQMKFYLNLNDEARAYNTQHDEFLTLKEFYDSFYPPCRLYCDISDSPE